MDVVSPPNVFGVVPVYGHAHPPVPSWHERVRRVGGQAGSRLVRATLRTATLLVAAAALLRRPRK